MGQERCNWCDKQVEQGDGWRLSERAGDRRAVFCRLEHVVPWVIQGARWDAAEAYEAPTAEAPEFCSQCNRGLGDAQLLLVRHRGEHRIPDRFCSTDHLLEWAKAGGRWRRPR